jgi:hypothetical protein
MSLINWRDDHVLEKILEVISVIQINTYVIATVKYLNAKNYDGIKIMVFENITKEKILKMKIIDPHFCETEISPIARFEPTQRGLSWAIKFVKTMSEV